MTIYCAYAKPTVAYHENPHSTNKKRASFQNLQYLKAGTESTTRSSDEFQGVWYSKAGMGDIGDGKYASAHLLPKGSGDREYCADLIFRDFNFNIPTDAKIRRIGLVYSAKTSSSQLHINAPTVSMASLVGKDLSKVYSKGDVQLYNSKDYNQLERGIIGSSKVTSTKRTMGYTYDIDGKNLTLSPSELNNEYFWLKLMFKGNQSNVEGDLLIDFVGVFVEYETPDYTLVNTDPYDKEVSGKGYRDAYIGEEIVHHIKLNNTNKVVCDESITKLNIPSCMTVVDADVSKGDFDLYRTGEYPDEFKARFINPSTHVKRGSFFKVQLVDSTNNNTPIPFVEVHFKYKGKVYTAKTSPNGEAVLQIKSPAGEHSISYSFVSEFYDPVMGYASFTVSSNRKVGLHSPDGEPNVAINLYKDSRFTITPRVVYSTTHQLISHANLVAIFREKKTPTTYGTTYTKKATSNSFGRAVFKLNLPPAIYEVNVQFRKADNPTLCTDEYNILDEAFRTFEVVVMPKPVECIVSCVNKPETEEGVTVYRMARHGVLGVHLVDDKGAILDSETVNIYTYRDGVTKSHKVTSDGNGNAWIKVDYGGSRRFTVKVTVQGMVVQNRNDGNAFKFYARTIEVPSDSKYNYKWVVQKPTNEYLNIHLVPKITGDCHLDIYNNQTGLNAPYNYDNHLFYKDDSILVSTNEVHYNTWEYVDFYLNFDPRDYNDEDLGVYGDVFTITNEFTDENTLIDWENLIVTSDSSSNVKKEDCVWSTIQDKNNVTLYVKPVDGLRYKLHCRVRVRSRDALTDISTGSPTYAFTIDIVGHTGGAYTKDLWVLAKLPLRITGKRTNVLVDRSSNQTNQGDWGEYIFDCAGHKDNYLDLKEDFRFTVHKPKIFIGMVELHRSHSKPTASDTQTLLEKQYKNRKIIRKKGDYKHKVDTTLRLPPADLATIDAMSRLDMPFPAHFANVQSWNPLNVHGWIELYQVTEQKEINSSLYEAKLDWEYLTRELYSLMTIRRDNKRVATASITNKSFDTVFYPEYPILDFFNMTGVGVLLDTYNEYEELEDGYGELIDTKTLEMAEISIESSQKIELTSKYALPNRCRITLNWRDLLPYYSNDYLENFIRSIRIKRVNEDTGLWEDVFEYTYTDFEHYDYSNEYTVDTVINEAKINALALDDDEWYNVANDRVVLDFDEDYVSSDPTGETYVDDEGEWDYRVGSLTVLTLEGNKLSILDEGHSGNELEVDDIILESGEYYLSVEMDNQSNLEDEEFTWESLLNVKVETDDNDYIYNKVYDDTVVSPAPLPNNILMYTRLGDDGMVYYYKYNKNKVYRYRGDPYNPYVNCCNIETFDGVSIFDCNNDYDPIVLQNGLVKVALNRYTGGVRFYKWKLEYSDTDGSSTDNYGQGRWEETFRLYNLDDNSHMSVDEYSTDRIVLSWGKTTWTIWRGRPFIDIKHPNTLFKIDTKVNTVLCDDINGDLAEYEVHRNRNLYKDLGNNNRLDERLISVSVKDLKPDYATFNVVLTDEDGNVLTDSIKVDSRLKVRATLLDKNSNKPLKNRTVYLLSDMGDGLHKDGLQLLTDDNGQVVFNRAFEHIGAVEYQVAFYGGKNYEDLEDTKNYNPATSDLYHLDIVKGRSETDIDVSFLVDGEDKSEVLVGSTVEVTGVLRTNPSVLWNKQDLTLQIIQGSSETTDTLTTTEILSEKADTGEIITDIKCYYAISESDAEATGEYSEDVSTVISELDVDTPYLWHYKEIYYDNGVIEEITPSVIFTYTVTEDETITVTAITETYALSEYIEDIPVSYDTLENINSLRACSEVPITLYFDNIPVDNAVTDENGAFEFSYLLEDEEETEDRDSHIGTHRLIVESAKTDTLKSDVEDHSYWIKTPSVLTVTHYTIVVDTPTLIEGNIVDSDGTALENWRAYIYLNGDYKALIRTDEQGNFEYTLPALSYGDYELYINVKPNKANGSIMSSTYTEEIELGTIGSVSLFTNKNTLSALDKDVAVLTTTVLDTNDEPLPNLKVALFEDDTFIGEGVTNEMGVFYYHYNSVGKGVISFKVRVGGDYSDTVVINDCLLYDNCTSDKGSRYIPLQIDSRGVVDSMSFDTDHYVLFSSEECYTGFIPYDIDDDVEVSVDFKLSNISSYIQQVVGFFDGNTTYGVRASENRNVDYFTRRYDDGQESSSTFYTHIDFFIKEYYRLKMVKDGTSLTLSIEDSEGTELASTTETITYSMYDKIFFGFLSADEREVYIKNIKVLKI